MTVKHRIIALRLLEKQKQAPALAKKTGVEIKINKIKEKEVNK